MGWFAKGSRTIWFVTLGMCLILVAVIVALAVLLAEERTVSTAPPTSTAPPPSGSGWQSKYGNYRYAAVAADAKDCSDIGTEMLAKDGSAVDAAIATLLCQGVLQCHNMGIGGGLFITVYDPRHQNVSTLIGRETAPASASRDMFINTGLSPVYGGAASGVPGEVAGYWAAHQRFGRLPWADLFTPAIKLCEDGFTVTRSLAGAISAKWNLSQSLDEILLNPNTNTYYKEGEVMTLVKLGDTLRRIATGGANEFYNGSLARDIVDDLNDAGGNFSLADLSSYRAPWKQPVTVTLQNGDLQLSGPTSPSSSLVTNLILNILDGYNFGPEDLNGPSKQTELLHKVIEAMKFAFAKRSWFGDEDFVDMEQLKAELQTDQLAAAIRANITDVTHPLEYYGPAFQIVEDSGTSHMSLLAQDGTAVGATSTVNLYFGSKMVGSRTGIIFNNVMDDFSTPNTTNSFGVPASETNYIEPGKRPMSSMSPTVVVNQTTNEAVMITGASGGTKIITGAALSMINALWLGMNISEALDVTRIHHQLIPEYLEYEETLDLLVVAGLESRGHELRMTTMSTAVQSIRANCSTTGRRQDACIAAACDGRKGGAPDGF